jgi:superfamily II DNA or RNA helicase
MNVMSTDTVKANIDAMRCAFEDFSAKQADLGAMFQPDYTPEQLENLGVYDALYRGKGPRLASLGEWKPEWVSEHDPKGWAQWYKRYAGGRRLPDEDARQIKRWTSFKARHGGPFTKNPTPRRGWALRNWGIDPSKLVAPDQSHAIREMLDEYKAKAMQKYVQDMGKQADLNADITLQDHQQRIADRVSGENPRMLVYHGLGSGKSLSALAAAEKARGLHGGNYGIVVPASLKGNFEKEVKKFTHGSNPEVMSYTGLGKGKQFQDQPETLIMDEAARLRNPDSAMTQAAMRQAREAQRVMLLTGTPITNAPSDLAPIVSILDGKSIDPKSFGERYVGYKKVNPGWLGWLRGVKPGERPYVKNEQELRKLLAGKVDYQPSKTPEGVNINEEVVRVPLSSEQQKIQHAIRTKVPPGFLWKLDREFPLSRDELGRLNSFLTGMRQVGLSTQPFRADKNPLKAFDQSSKLQKAMENLKSTLNSDPRKKAIIYSNFVDSGLGPYAAGLEREGVPHAFFHGGVSPKARQAAVDEYNAGKLRALLIGPAGAEGISTKGTSLIQLLDPHWNEARTQQARGRGLRFDSHRDLPEELKNVAVQRYIASSEEPGFIGKHIMGKQRERTGDEVLERLTAEKEQLNESFRNLLREIGTPPAKTAMAMLNTAEGQAWLCASHA